MADSGARPPVSVAVALPTRGLIHSRTIESVMRALDHAERLGVAARVNGGWLCIAHGLPIPESHERATDLAMQTGAEVVLFAEDDNVWPEIAVVELLATLEQTGAGMAAINYPVGTRGTRWTSVYRENGEVLFCGFGITAIRADVFRRLERPWYPMDRWYGRIPVEGGGTRLGFIDRPWPTDKAGRKVNGGIDVAFGIRVREDAGYTIAEVPHLVGAQLRVVKMGAASGSGLNEEPHRVEVWDTIDADQRAFQAQDLDRFDIRAIWHAWKVGFRTFGPWKSQFWLGDQPFGGTYDAMHDERIVLARDTFRDARTVLELGAFEGGHTAAIARWADRVVGVEGRPENAAKARWILGTMEATNAEIVEADLEAMRLADLGSFDLVVALGVLYHVREPVKLIAKMADAAPNAVIWTHVSPTDERFEYAEFGHADPLSGLSETSVWLPRDELLAALHERYATVEIADEWHPGEYPATSASFMNTTMPSMTIIAKGAR